MTFERPELLHALWALVLIPLLYLIRRRARPAVVAHLFLWKRVLHHEGRSRLRRIREIVSILLQALVVASLVLAWARPVLTSPDEGESRTLVVVDTSFTMGARMRNGRSRLDAARAVVEAELAAWSRLGSVAVTTVGPAVHPRLDFTRDAALVGGALDAIAAHGFLDGDALRRYLAARMARLAPSDHVVVITDGASSAWSDAALLPASVDVRRVGDLDTNAAITAIEVEALGERRVRVKARVETHGAALRRRVTLLADGAEVAGREVALESGGTATVDLEADVDPGRWLRVVLAADPGDAWPEDDMGEAWWAHPPRAKVLVVTKELDRHMKSALAVLDDVIDRGAAGTAAPDAWRRAGEYDLVILVGVEEGRPLPAGRYLLIDSWAPGLPMRRDGRTKDVEIVRQNDDVILRGIDLRNLSVAEATRIGVERGAKSVLQASSGSLITRGTRGDVSFLHLAFSTDVRNTTLPLLSAWPLLIRDAITSLCPDRRRVFPPAVARGEVFTSLRTVDRDDRTAVFAEFQAGDAVATVPLEEIGPGPTLRAPARAGRATLHIGSIGEAVAVNPGSSRLADVRSKLTDRSAVTRPPVAREMRAESVAARFLLLALAFLLLEWLLFHLGWTR